MSKKYYPYLIALLLLSAGCHRTVDPVTLKRLHTLLDKSEYFKLDAEYKLVSKDLSDANRLYFKAYLDNAFNRNTDCIKDVGSLLDQSAKYPDSVKTALKHLQADSYFKTFQYAKAAKCDSDILKYPGKKDFVDDIKNDLVMRNGLKNVPAQQTIIKNNISFHWKRDVIGLIEIPVSANKQSFDAIFDTRANISTISQTYARKLGLRILDATYTEGSGATGNKFKTGMGIADSINVGGIEIKNIFFQVMPDSILYIAPIKQQLNIIIGFPVIEQWREVHIFKDGRMTIPLNPIVKNLHNLALNGLDMVITLQTGSDTLSFDFDSGASTSMLYQSYFNRYKAMVLKTAIKKTVGFGGAGGSQKKEVWILPKLNLGINGKMVTVDSVSVLTKPIFPGEKFYGNIGQDFIKQYSEVVYNFKDMYFDGIL